MICFFGIRKGMALYVGMNFLRGEELSHSVKGRVGKHVARVDSNQPHRLSLDVNCSRLFALYSFPAAHSSIHSNRLFESINGRRSHTSSVALENLYNPTLPVFSLLSMSKQKCQIRTFDPLRLHNLVPQSLPSLPVSVVYFRFIPGTFPLKSRASDRFTVKIGEQWV